MRIIGNIKVLGLILPITAPLAGCMMLQTLVDPDHCEYRGRGLRCYRAFPPDEEGASGDRGGSGRPANDARRKPEPGGSVSRVGEDLFVVASQQAAIGEHRTAIELFEKAAREFREHGDRLPEAECHQQLMWLYTTIGEPAAAAAHGAEAARLASAYLDWDMQAQVLLNVAEVHLRHGDLETALLYYRRAVVAIARVGDDETLAAVYETMAELAEATGDEASARIYRIQSERLRSGAR